MSFDSPIRDLRELLDSVQTGKIQLPDFQRPWKWDVDRICSLLASLAKGLPVGVVMALETGSEEVNFAVRPISGVHTENTSPDWLLLDGQQRLTSLFQSLKSHDAVDTTDTRGKAMRGWFYIRIAESLDEDLDMEDDAIFFVPEDRMIKSDFGRKIDEDYSTTDLEVVGGAYPLNRIFDQDFLMDYMLRVSQQVQPADKPLFQQFTAFTAGPLRTLQNYKVPVIELRNTTSREAVCTVFEKVNTGGVALNVFELLTATFAAGSADFRLNDDWQERKKRMVAAHDVLGSVENTDFLQAVSLLASRQRRMDHLGNDEKRPGITCKRKDILKLTVDDYRTWAEPLTKAFIWAGQFLNNQSIFKRKDIPYRTQLVPLAALRVTLGTEADLMGVSKLLNQWYWCGVLGELYGGAVETRFARDLEEVEQWVRGGNEPGTVAGASFDPARLFTLRTRNSAAYKGIYALTMGGNVKDWVNNQTINQGSYQDFGVDIHHIFPQKWCVDNGIDDRYVQSIVNKTPISAATNRFISAKAPSKYVGELAAKAQVDLDEVRDAIRSHLVPVELLESGDFDGFFEARKVALLEVIGGAMGKPVLVQTTTDVAEAAEWEEAVLVG
ncbi:DUF262 domain-containing protein [Arthrobacter sp. H35-D1]|uniref:GmrSD restriction endonuclease domain-containing protein n=1 Tax=Arthrobacter sp. H35-D1 TaxID=3046202 RepID=UPI0024B95F38|nr:DUF262 domain-containing protein [Arthrobacter sp. H35-D1]MDJ0312714.1 DUF262 domain-containing protein [Arthrobacter sp. H35-D1]